VPGPPVAIGAPVAVVGQTIAGQPPNAQLVVTVLSVRSIPSRDFDTLAPPGGTAGVLLRIMNSGSHAFTDDLSGDVELLSADGRTSPGPALTAPDHGFCANNVNVTHLNLQPGRTLTVCVPVTPPSGAKPTLLRFTPDGGQSMDYAQWHLR
jgi:hypothetical protein